MKRARVHFLVTAVLLVALSALLIDVVVPLQAARLAVCGYGSCIISCEGENCHCGHVGPDYVECYCNGYNAKLYC